MILVHPTIRSRKIIVTIIVYIASFLILMASGVGLVEKGQKAQDKEN